MTLIAMSCAEVEPLLPLVADGSVDPDADPGLFAHLASCPSCQQLVAEHDLVTIALERGASLNAPVTRQPKSPLRLWLPIATAASLVIAGTIVWRLANAPGTARDQTDVTRVAVSTAPSPQAAPIAKTIVTDKPEVICITRANGSIYYLVRRNDSWQPIDPATIDGSDADNQHTNLGTPTKY